MSMDDDAHRVQPAAARPGADAHGTAVTARAAQLVPLLLIMLLVLALLAGISSRSVTPALGDDAPADRFSASRAVQATAGIVEVPRPGGTPANDAAREELSAQLTDLGFTVTEDEGIGVRSTPERTRTGYVRNLVATRPGTDPTGTIVLATHIDSVPGAPGAADAGIGLAVILETVRALGPEALRNDLVVLLVDGEERGLLGAEHHLAGAGADLTAPVVVLNHEARGITGRPLLTRAHGPMHRIVGAAPRPEFESFTDALFAIIPNDTDFTVYREGGWWGFDMAIIDGSFAYHSPLDDSAHLDHDTLQHYGDLTLALTRDLAGRDLAELSAHTQEHPVQTTMPLGILQIPPLLLSILAVLAPLAIAVTIGIRRRRAEITIRGVLAGAVCALVVIAGGVAGAVGLWTVVSTKVPHMLSRTVGEPVRAHGFILAELLLALAIVLLGLVLARMLLRRASLLLGTSLVVTVLLAVLGVAWPALGGSMLPPAVVAAAGILGSTIAPPVLSVLLRAAAILPTGWLLGTQLSSLTEFGIASAAGAYAGTALIALGAAAALWLPRTADPVPDRIRRPRRLLAPAAVLIATAALSLGSTWWTLRAPEPMQESVIATVDAATGQTHWYVSGMSAWGRDLDGTTAQSTIEMPQVRTDGTSGGRSTVTVTAVRDGTELWIDAAEGPLREITIDGTPVAAAEGQDGIGQLQIAGIRAGQNVEITLSAAPGTELSVTEVTYDPSLAQGWSEPGADVVLMQPRLEVTTTVQL